MCVSVNFFLSKISQNLLDLSKDFEIWYKHQVYTCNAEYDNKNVNISAITWPRGSVVTNDNGN